jgi:hypothetical protein
VNFCLKEASDRVSVVYDFMSVKNDITTSRQYFVIF